MDVFITLLRMCPPPHPRVRMGGTGQCVLPFCVPLPVRRLLGNERAVANGCAEMCVTVQNVRSCGDPSSFVKRIASGSPLNSFKTSSGIL